MTGRRASLLTAIIPTIERPTLVRAVASVERQTVEAAVHVERDPQRTGTAPTLNRGLEHIRTGWLCTLGDDDVLHPQYAEWLMDEMAQQDMVIFRMQYESGFVLPLSDRVAALRHGAVGASYAMRTELARELGGWRAAPPELGAGKSSEDWMMIAAAREARARMKVLPLVAYYVQHDPVGRLRDGEATEAGDISLRASRFG